MTRGMGQATAAGQHTRSSATTGAPRSHARSARMVTGTHPRPRAPVRADTRNAPYAQTQQRSAALRRVLYESDACATRAVPGEWRHDEHLLSGYGMHQPAARPARVG